MTRAAPFSQLIIRIRSTVFHVFFPPFFGVSNLKLVGSPDQTSKWKKGVTKQKGICSIRKDSNQIKRQILKLQIGGAPPDLAQTTKKLGQKRPNLFRGHYMTPTQTMLFFLFFGTSLNKKKDIDLPWKFDPHKINQTFDKQPNIYLPLGPPAGF